MKMDFTPEEIVVLRYAITHLYFGNPNICKQYPKAIDGVMKKLNVSVKDKEKRK